ncbi:hypothetical protein CEXT_741411 [Caerostris extrusa]|uniref:Uncharacterized protein n=1 Tax=Caerostris extrusa TaxID=172846 RepID=A0AAV4UC18_CAEEX|nr:hypothetical protein CEXT_741411 [Caerostris extrusa]
MRSEGKKRRNEVLALHPLAARTLRFSAPAGHPHFPPAEENAPRTTPWRTHPKSSRPGDTMRVGSPSQKCCSSLRRSPTPART